MSYSPGDRVKVRRGSRWLACEVMSDDGDGWVVARREDTGKRIIAGAAEVQSAERPARKLPPPMAAVIDVVVDPAMAPGTWRLENAQPKPTPPLRSRSYADFVRGHACQNCGAPPPSEHAHFGPRGMSRKADDRAANALCSRCHRHFHDHGKLPFWRRREALPIGDVSREATENALHRWQRDLLIEWLDIVQERKARRG